MGINKKKGTIPYIKNINPMSLSISLATAVKNAIEIVKSLPDLLYD